MTRTVVYARPEPAPIPAPPPRVPVPAGATRGIPPVDEAPPPAPPAPPAAAAPADGYIDKLVKYVPAEVVAVFAPLAAVIGSRHGLLLTLAIVCLFATPAYLLLTALNQPAEQRPLPHYYVLAALAFAAWAIGVSQDLDKLFAFDSVVVAFVLGLAVVLVPAADGLLAKLKI